MTAPAKRLTDQQVDQAIDAALTGFIETLTVLTGDCDWATDRRMAKLDMLRATTRRNINQMMRYREPRD